MIEDELNALGRVDEIEIDETAAVIVEQIEDEITVSIASVVSVYLQLTPEQAIKLSRALAVASGEGCRIPGIRRALASPLPRRQPDFYTTALVD